MTSPVTLSSLADRPFWVAWRLDIRNGKMTKVPYSPVAAGGMAKADDPSTWGTLAEARKCAEALGVPNQIGVEFTDLDDDSSLGGIDLDSCRDAATGIVDDWALDIATMFGTYAEVSPSGTGLKLYFRFCTADLTRIRDAMRGPAYGKKWARRSAGDHPPAIELYIGNRYFAVTEQTAPEITPELRLIETELLLDLIRIRGPEFTAGDKPKQAAGKSAGNNRGSDQSRSAIAFRIGYRNARSGATFDQMMAAIRADPDAGAWAQEKGDERQFRRIWDRAKANASELILSPAAPLESAREYIRQHHTSDGTRTLHHQNSTFYAWKRSHYVERTPEELRAALYRFLDGAKTETDEGELLPFNPSKGKVANVLEATAAESQLSRLVRAPAWLHRSDEPAAAEIIACNNGLLHLTTGTVCAHSPDFFTLNALNFDYQPNALEPREWLAFLKTVWPNDEEAIKALQEMFGLCLTGETKYQKALLIVGPRRSGKGTIARVLTQLLGAANVCGPTLSALGTNFGLAPLIGKRLAIISDARLSGKADQQVIVERLLSITGEDSLTIDRKNRDHWTGKLDTRFVILTNELPRLSDSSGALAGRFVILRMIRSFYGREDLSLAAKLEHELPGILIWAIQGWKRLTERGHFVPPGSARAAMQELEDLGSPIGAFLRDACMVGQGYSVRTDLLYSAWCDWCRQQGRDHAGTVQAFGRDLGAAIAGLEVVQHRVREKSGETKVCRFYEGVALDVTGRVSRDVTRDTPLHLISDPDDPGPLASEIHY